MLETLKRLATTGSLREVRIRNFVSCLEDSPGVTVTMQNTAAGKVVVHLAPGVTMSGEAIRMIQTENVYLDVISAEDTGTQLEFRIE